MTDFFAMGGYAFYVWSSWAIGVVVLIAITWHSLSSVKITRAELNILENPEPEHQGESDA
ncbi:MAG: heme exporter protein CcmD [Candidatus Puniceispirillales bacterium]